MRTADTEPPALLRVFWNGSDSNHAQIFGSCMVSLQIMANSFIPGLQAAARGARAQGGGASEALFRYTAQDKDSLKDSERSIGTATQQIRQ